MKNIFGFDYMHDGGPFRSRIDVFQESPTILIVRMTDATDANRMASFGPWELSHLPGVKVKLSFEDRYVVQLTTEEGQIPGLIQWLRDNYEKNRCE